MVVAVLTPAAIIFLLPVLLTTWTPFSRHTPPREAVVVITCIAALLVAAVQLPLAVRWGNGLRGGEEKMRIKMMGVAAVDLAFGVVLAVGALRLNSWASVTVPESVFTVIAVWVGFAILLDLSFLFLLTAPSTREWFEAHRDY